MRIKVEKKEKKRKNRVKNKSVVRFLLVPIIFGRNLTHVKYLSKSLVTRFYFNLSKRFDTIIVMNLIIRRKL